MTEKPKRTHWLFVAAVSAFSLALFVFTSDINFAADTPAVKAIKTTGTHLEGLHVPKTSPQPGDWLASHDEPGQTFNQYRNSRPNLPTKTRTTFYFQPVGEFDDAQEEMIEQTADLMTRFYGMPTKILMPIDLETVPARARRIHPEWKVPQILTTYVMDDVLKPNVPKDAVAVLALTTTDLWPGEGWNFVFGMASLRDRVGVWSLARYGDPKTEPELYRKRLFKVAVHESGHMLGIKHCTSHECLMNGSNHLEEMDSRPMWFCPDDLQKIWWGCKVDPAKRFESLIEFAEQHKMKNETQFWKTSLQLLQSKNGSAKSTNTSQ